MLYRNVNCSRCLCPAARLKWEKTSDQVQTSRTRRLINKQQEQRIVGAELLTGSRRRKNIYKWGTATWGRQRGRVITAVNETELRYASSVHRPLLTAETHRHRKLFKSYLSEKLPPTQFIKDFLHKVQQSSLLEAETLLASFSVWWPEQTQLCVVNSHVQVTSPQGQVKAIQSFKLDFDWRASWSRVCTSKSQVSFIVCKQVLNPVFWGKSKSSFMSLGTVFKSKSQVCQSQSQVKSSHGGVPSTECQCLILENCVHVNKAFLVSSMKNLFKPFKTEFRDQNLKKTASWDTNID